MTFIYQETLDDQMIFFLQPYLKLDVSFGLTPRESCCVISIDLLATSVLVT